MANMKFTKGGSTFTFVDGRKYPIDDQPQVNVVVDYSEGKQLYAYDKGVEETFIYLDLDRICQADHDNLEPWFKNTAVGPKNTFTFTDENSTEHTVRWMDIKYPLKEVSSGRFSGLITLRKEI
jgi:hypothetical protein